jgi:hypothetical protein
VASKLAEPESGAVDVESTPIPPLSPLPPTRTSPRRQQLLSKYAIAASAIAASTDSVSIAAAPPTTSNLSCTSSLTADSRMGASASIAKTSLSNKFESYDDDDDEDSKDYGGNNNDSSIAMRKKWVDSDDDSDGGEKEVAGGGRLTEDEIEVEINLFGGCGDDDSIGDGGGTYDYATQDYEFFDCVWHWMDPITLINERNRRAVEACILIEAGQSVDESATTDENCLHESMRVTCMRLLRDIPRNPFESVAVMDAMLLQLKGGKEPSFSGKSLWRRQKELRRSIRALAAEMPGASNFHLLPSGNSLRDAMKKLICKKFAKRKGAKKVYDEVMDAWDEIPIGWWMEHNSIVFILALMVHRQSPTIINAAALATPGKTHDEQQSVSAASIAQERRLESVKRHQSKQSSQKSSVDSVFENTYKAAQVEGMKGVAIKHRITAAEMKLRMMNENRAFYVAAAADTATGEAQLNKKIKTVIDNLPDTFEDLTGDNNEDTNE